MTLLDKIEEIASSGIPASRTAPEGGVQHHGFTDADDTGVLQQEVNRLVALDQRRGALTMSSWGCKFIATVLETANERARTPLRLRGFSNKIMRKVDAGDLNNSLLKVWKMWQMDTYTGPGLGLLLELMGEIMTTHEENIPAPGAEDGRELGMDSFVRAANGVRGLVGAATGGLKNLVAYVWGGSQAGPSPPDAKPDPVAAAEADAASRRTQEFDPDAWS